MEMVTKRIKTLKRHGAHICDDGCAYLPVYRGTDGNGASWYSTDKEHAEVFGSIITASIRLVPSQFIEIDGRADQYRGGGYPAEEAMIDNIESSGKAFAVLHHWEGDGLTVYVRPEHINQVVC